MPLIPAYVFQALGIINIGYKLTRWAFNQNTSAAEEIKQRQSLVRSQISEAVWGFGKFRINGSLVRFSDIEIGEEEVEVDFPASFRGSKYKNSKERIIGKRFFTVLIENSIQNFDSLYIDNEQVYLEKVSGLLNEEPIEYYIASTAPLDAEIAKLKQQLRDLGNPVDYNPYQSPRGPSEPAYVYQIYDQIEYLEDKKANFKWLYNVGAEGTNKSLFRIYLDTNTGADISSSSADKIAKEWVGDNWDGTGSQLENLAWVAIELYAFSENPEAFSNRIPNFQFVLEAEESNPARVAQWYLNSMCDVPLDDILGIDSAAAICDEKIVFPSVSLGDEVDKTKLVNSIDVLKILFPEAVDNKGELIPALLPNATEQTNALNLWNSEYSGAANAQARYQLNGIITTDMLLNPYSLFGQLEQAMFGHIVSIAGQWKVIAGAPRDTVLTITEDDLEEQPSWILNRGIENRINAIKANIAQDRNNNFNETSINQIFDPEYIDTQGYSEYDIGTLPFQIDETVARRIINLEIRRRSPDLIAANITINRGINWQNWSLLPGDRVELALRDDDTFNDAYIIEQIESDENTSRINLTLLQNPDSLYSDRFDNMLPSIGSKNESKRTIVILQRLSVIVTAELRFISAQQEALTITEEDNNPVTIPNPEYDSSPAGSIISFDRAQAEGTTVPARTGNFQSRYILDINYEVATQVRSIKTEVIVASANRFGRNTISRFIQRFDLTEDEIELGLFTRTAKQDNNIRYFSANAAHIIALRVTGYSKPGTDSVPDNIAGEAFTYNVPGRGTLSFADLKDYKRESEIPSDGKALMYRGGGWEPSLIVRVVDDIENADIRAGEIVATEEEE